MMHDLLPSFSFYITSSFIIIFLGSPIEASPQASLVRIAQEWSRVIIAKEKMSYDRYGESIDRNSENRPPKKGKPFRHFVTGDLVDVQDHKDTWYEAEIKDVDCDDRGNIDRVLVHFFFGTIRMMNGIDQRVIRLLRIVPKYGHQANVCG